MSNIFRYRYVMPGVLIVLSLLLLVSLLLVFFEHQTQLLEIVQEPLIFNNNSIYIDTKNSIRLDPSYFSKQYNSTSLDILMALTAKHPLVSDLSVLKSSLETWASSFHSNDRFLIYSGSLSKTSKNPPNHIPKFNLNNVVLRKIACSFNSNPFVPSVLSKLPFRSLLSKHKPETDNQVFSLYWLELKDVKDSEYPALNKNLLQWEHMARMTAFKWYMRCDDDAYVNLKLYRQLLLQLDHTKPFYIGNGALGRAQERKILKLTSGNPYAQGGYCQAFSAGAQSLVLNCRDSVKKWLEELGSNHTHDDVELGRCFMEQGLVLDDLGLPKEDIFVHVGNVVNGTEPMKTLNADELELELRRPRKQCPLVVHPLKSADKMHLTHKLVEQMPNCKLHSKKYAFSVEIKS
eukprot:CAMPEP_0182448610 /NCGR_PEP_ID=MMETSP1172-20130603/28454_1 /TAXON_ID=708627 /ORGANISM="Timspurckia oligopyrenoides, Strain CCMP3278" /LENGTH=403 /DNA_ID=CAMNT_0024645545 /DNA_START=139 /DNA_END=1350 /DNA_ORIENTATION=-